MLCFYAGVYIVHTFIASSLKKLDISSPKKSTLRDKTDKNILLNCVMTTTKTEHRQIKLQILIFHEATIRAVVTELDFYWPKAPKAIILGLS